MMFAGHPWRIVLGHVEIAAEQLDHGQQRQEPAVRYAVRLAHGDAACPPALDELEAEAALARPRLTDHADDGAVPAAHALEDGVERGQLAVPADELGEPARLRAVEARAQRPQPGELEDAHGLGDALHFEGADLVEREIALDELRHGSREVDAPGFGELLHAGGEADGRPLRRVVHEAGVPDRAHDDLAAVEAHAHGEVEPTAHAQLVAPAAELLLEVERGIAGALRVILVRDGSTEQRHQAVARVLVHGALEARDPLRHDLEEAVEDAVPVLRIGAPGERERALHVGEQHGQLLALAFERAARGEELVAQAPRHTRRRRPWAGFAGLQARTALVAEPGVVPVRTPAGRAGHRGALRTKPRRAGSGP